MMNQNFPVEIRYLKIQWHSNKEVASMDIADNYQEIEFENGNFTAHTSTFAGVNIYVGFKFLEEINHTPYIIIDEFNHQSLISIKKPASDAVWWIQSNQWDNKTHRYLSDLQRTAGVVEFVFNQQKLLLSNDTHEFSVSELEHYLSDFKSDLWFLILDNDGISKSNIQKSKVSFVDNELIGLYRECLDNIQQITQNPNMFLSEHQIKKSKKQVKPVTKTFREIITNPNAKLLTSRSFYESYDTPENRYVHFCLKRIKLLFAVFDNISKKQDIFYQYQIEQNQKIIDDCNETTTKKIDKEVYFQEIETMKSQLQEHIQLYGNFCNYICNHWQDFTHLQINPINQITIQFGKYAEYYNGYFVARLDGYSKEQLKQQYNIDYVVVSFHQDILDYINSNNLTLNYLSLSLTGEFFVPCDKNNNGKNYYQIFISRIDTAIFNNENHTITSLRNAIANQEQKYTQYEQNDWKEPLNQTELSELNREKETAEKKLQFLSEQLKVNGEINHKLPTLKQQVKKLLKFFDIHKIRTQSYCPNSMVFIQNPIYNKHNHLFKKINDYQGISESVFKLLLEVEQIGLVNIASLYEKWCLLQIIKVLTKNYHYKLSNNWQEYLVKSVLSKQYNIGFVLENDNIQRKIVLTYEKELLNGKRPDFVIDLYTKTYTQDNNGNWFIDNEKFQERLVIDAKFKSKMSEYKVNQLVDELYTDKNYGEDGTNIVFILQPTSNIINNKTSPLNWGSFCDYGQSNQSKHKKGHIFLSPSMKYPNSIDHLQRLFGFFLQKNAEFLKMSKHYWVNIGCISCGGASNIQKTFTRGGKERFLMNCPNCKQLSVQTVCYQCGTKLFKNGLKWTYHRTKAEQISNVVCYECERFL